MPLADEVLDHAKTAGFAVERVHALGPHYAITLRHWAHALQTRRVEAIAMTSPETYDSTCGISTVAPTSSGKAISTSCSSAWQRSSGTRPWWPG
ncbi:class I SAM-dependent methyltransferase [Nocardia sp. NPDC004260]